MEPSARMDALVLKSIIAIALVAFAAILYLHPALLSDALNTCIGCGPGDTGTALPVDASKVMSGIHGGGDRGPAFFAGAGAGDGSGPLSNAPHLPSAYYYSDYSEGGGSGGGGGTFFSGGYGAVQPVNNAGGKGPWGTENKTFSETGAAIPVPEFPGVGSLAWLIAGLVSCVAVIRLANRHR